jgi:3-phenylpropionate/trans-cinnamate dioxygenase ferredoxin subunit
MLRSEVDGNAVCIVHAADGAYFALDDMCSHGKSSLSERGELFGRQVECGMHGTLFDVASGEPLTPPATIPLRTYRIVADGDDLVLSATRSDRC